MRITKSGVVPQYQLGKCSHCGCEVEDAKNTEIVWSYSTFLDDRWRVKCPTKGCYAFICVDYKKHDEPAK